MSRFDLSKIGPAVRALNAATLGGLTVGYTPSGPIVTNSTPMQAKKARGKRQPTKTEAAAIEYLKRLPDVVDVRFNPMSLHLANGHRYTPDASFIRSGVLHIVEVKGSYRLGSLQRSRLAYDQARIEWPMFTFWWMERQKDGTWRFKA